MFDFNKHLNISHPSVHYAVVPMLPGARRLLTCLPHLSPIQGRPHKSYDNPLLLASNISNKVYMDAS